jgi:hypothetical protein
MGEVRRAWTLLASAALLALALVGTLLVTPSSAASGESVSVPLGCSAAVLPGEARCFTTIHRPSASVGDGVHAFTTQAPRGGITPAAIAAIYDLPAIPDPVPVGTSETVALVEAGGFSGLESELNDYREAYGLGACTQTSGCLTILNQKGAAAPLPADDADWAWETVMDAEAVAAACPACKILVVEANDNDTVNLDKAVAVAAARAQYVSMSWGSLDDGMTATDAASTEAIFAGHPDVTFVAATGDFGWSTHIPSPDGDPAHALACGTKTVPSMPDETHSCSNYPASSPHVVAAGGTTAVQSADGSWTQRMWGAADDDGSPNAGGVSSGCSGWTQMNASQKLNGRARGACDTARGTADISALADGFATYHHDANSDWWLGGGTSLAAPLLTAMYAQAGNHTSPFDIYARATAEPAAFTDVTSGAATRGCPANDKRHLCSAGAGWDGPTGLGTPHGLRSLEVYTGPVLDDPTPASYLTPITPPSTAPKPTPTKTPALQRVHHSGKVKVKGKARVRAKLRASYGVFEAGSTVTVTWLIKKKAVARGIKVRVRKAWLRRKLRYVVTATAAGRLSLSLTSPPVKVKRR